VIVCVCVCVCVCVGVCVCVCVSGGAYNLCNLVVSNLVVLLPTVSNTYIKLLVNFYSR